MPGVGLGVSASRSALADGGSGRLESEKQGFGREPQRGWIGEAVWRAAASRGSRDDMPMGRIRLWARDATRGSALAWGWIAHLMGGGHSPAMTVAAAGAIAAAGCARASPGRLNSIQLACADGAGVGE